MGQATIRYQPIGDAWETLGTGRNRGVIAQGIEATTNEWGPDQLNFTLQTQAGEPRPDLLPFTPIQLEVDGLLVWSGRVKAKPGNDRDISVQCEGWQYHLDDDLFERMFVWNGTFIRARIFRGYGPPFGWKDIRQHHSVDHTKYETSYTCKQGDGGILLSLPNGAAAATSSGVGAVFDAGPNDTVKRVVVTYKGGGAANFYLAATSITSVAGTEAESITIDAAPIATGSTTVGATFATARRYMRLQFENVSGAPIAGTATSWCRIIDVLCFADTAYESGNASILKADTVVKAVLPSAPLLNQSVASISAGTFNIPEYRTEGPETPRSIIETVNSYENYRCKIGGPDLKTLVYGAHPTTPLFEVGQRAGARFSDDSTSGEDIFNQVIVDGTGIDDQPVRVTRTQTGTIVDRQGFDRTRVLQVRSALTTTAANQLGDKWLADHRTIPLAGKLTGTGAFVRTVTGGASVPPASLLLQAGEMIRLAHRRDPDTGAQGRDGRIVGVSYRPDGDSLVIDIDDRRSSFDRVLAQREAGTR